MPAPDLAVPEALMEIMRGVASEAELDGYNRGLRAGRLIGLREIDARLKDVPTDGAFADWLEEEIREAEFHSGTKAS